MPFVAKVFEEVRRRKAKMLEDFKALVSGEDTHRDLCSMETSKSKRMAHCEECRVSGLCSSDTKNSIVTFSPPSMGKPRQTQHNAIVTFSRMAERCAR